MTARADNVSAFDQTREKLNRDSHLHGIHWLVIGLSLLLTLGAWYITKQQVDEKVASRFQRESQQVVKLVAERMRRYEDALWGGVGAHAASPQGLDHASWRAFANTLRIQEKYPGINGIGIIQKVTQEQLPYFLSAQRLNRPDFKVHPAHGESELLPITYIEPENINRAAVGLDVAHEANRYSAAKKARDTGLAKITGPIVLVQDSEKTPGFLFYAPYYRQVPAASIDDRRRKFIGLVYAPFVVKKLMQGVLDKESRHVGIKIADGGETLYSEHYESNPDFDPEPMFQRETALELYGRTWKFDIWSTHSFRVESSNAQPLVILLGGLFIDALLFALFVILSRANRQALVFADQATAELRRRSNRLERSNADLEQFAYVASHDLQEPLRMVGNFSQLLRRHYQSDRDPKSDQYFDFVLTGVQRMQLLLKDLLDYSRIGADSLPMNATNPEQACRDAVRNLHTVVEEQKATIDIAPLPIIDGELSQLTRLFQNLIGNALKFTMPERPPHIDISVEDRGAEWCFRVQDNGIGIETRYFEKIFVMFQRLHEREQYAGTGVGLAICKKIVLAHGGEIWAESEPGVGSSLFFTIPKRRTGSVRNVGKSNEDNKPLLHNTGEHPQLIKPVPSGA